MQSIGLRYAKSNFESSSKGTIIIRLELKKN